MRRSPRLYPILALLLAVLTALTPAAAAAGERLPLRGIHFSEMVYTVPDVDALDSDIAALSAAIGQDLDPYEVLEHYDDLCARYNEADSQLSYCYLRYSLNVTDTYWHGEYTGLYERLLKTDHALSQLGAKILRDASLAPYAREEWGDDFADRILLDAELSDERVLDALSREQELISEYDRMIGSFTYTWNGRQLTPDEIAAMYLSDEISFAEYEKLFNAYSEALNEQAFFLFSELVLLRTGIAETLGYESYAEYCYDGYDRDYSPEDAAALCEAVKAILVPVYRRAVLRISEIYSMSPVTKDESAYLEALGTVAEDFDPQISAAFERMLRDGLYDFSNADTKMEGSFTTYIASYRSPFISCRFDGSAESVRAGMHELGHFTRFLLDPDGDTSLDLDEVDSQGLELLLSAYDPVFFGRNVELATASLLIDAMYAVISGCMEDEFQRLVYASPGMTREEINGAYRRIANEYGLGSLYGYTGTEWAQIEHTFQVPFYYISYATGMIASLELWEESRTDPGSAKARYLSILNRPGYSRFRGIIEGAGLKDPLTEEAVRGIADSISARLSLSGKRSAPRAGRAP